MMPKPREHVLANLPNIGHKLGPEAEIRRMMYPMIRKGFSRQTAEARCRKRLTAKGWQIENLILHYPDEV